MIQFCEQLYSLYYINVITNNNINIDKIIYWREHLNVTLCLVCVTVATFLICKLRWDITGIGGNARDNALTYKFQWLFQSTVCWNRTVWMSWFLLLNAGYIWSLIMWMGWDYISELQPPTGLLSTTQVIHEHGEPWWNDTDRRNLLIHPPEHSGNSTSRVI
jgi:hypothetical protein